MRLLVLSDLHAESTGWQVPVDLPAFDVCILAGDIDKTIRRAINWLGRSDQDGFVGHPILYVPGNHEFFMGEIGDRLGEGRAAARYSGNVTLLDRASVVIDGVRFIGATLWTDYALHGARLQHEVMARAAVGVRDHYVIRVRDEDGAVRTFMPADALARHKDDLAFIQAALAEPFDGETVVVTHHAPHLGSLAERFKDDMVSGAFVSDLTETIERGRPALWVHGHTHDSFDYRVGETRIVCNPRGYGNWRSENGRFDERLIIEV